MTFDAVLLSSFGGPESPEEVMPFLERVTAGRGVPRERLEVVAEHYLALGGVSPINEQNRQLLAALRRRMDERGIDLPLYWGNRNSAPFFADTVRDLSGDGHRRVLAIATSAYSSYSGCRQYRENLAAALDAASVGTTGLVEIVKARPYVERAGFIAPFTDGVVQAIRAISDPSAAHVLFTTHSVPTAMAEASGPDDERVDSSLYERQHRDAARRVMAGLEEATGVTGVPWQLVFQSRSGPPQVPWLEPDVGDAIRSLAASGVTTVIVVPIGFVSDHVEVVWDLDHEARAIAEEVGVTFIRVGTPGVDPRFVDALVDIVVDAQAGRSTTTSARWCDQTCCLNPRMDLPVVAGC